MERAQGVKHNKGRQANVFERCSETFHPLFVPHSSIIFAVFSGLPPLWLTSSFGAPSFFTNCCSCWIGLASAFKHSHWVFVCANWHLFSWVVNSPIFKSSAWKKRFSLFASLFWAVSKKNLNSEAQTQELIRGLERWGRVLLGKGVAGVGRMCKVFAACRHQSTVPSFFSLFLLPQIFALLFWFVLRIPWMASVPPTRPLVDRQFP